MVLTRQGWAVLVSSLVLFLIGRLLGTMELIIFAFAAAVLVIVSLVRAVIVQVDLTVTRHIQPLQPHVNQPCKVALEITNASRRRSPVLRLREDINGELGADLGIPRIRGKANITAHYDLQTNSRGITTIGPLELNVVDPFNLTRVSVAAADIMEITVYPRIDPLRHLPITGRHNPDAGFISRQAMGRSSEEFFALRPFQHGDELRRVHWRATARHDELQVRQTNTPIHSQVTVLLDLRDDIQTVTSLDKSVSATASILTLALRLGDQIRLIATDRSDSGITSSNAGYTAILDYLATVTLKPAADLAKSLNLLKQPNHNGALIVVTGEMRTHDRKQIDLLAPQFASVTTVVVAHTVESDELGISFYHRPEDVVVTPRSPFVNAWGQVMSKQTLVRRFLP